MDSTSLISIVRIKELLFEVYDAPKNFGKKSDGLDIDLDFDLVIKDNQIIVWCHINISLNMEDELFKLIHTDYAITYEIQDLEQELKSNEFNLTTSLLGMSYSTLRGCIHSKTLGYKINNFILPPLTPKLIYKYYKKKKDEGQSNRHDTADKTDNSESPEK